MFSDIPSWVLDSFEDKSEVATAVWDDFYYDQCQLGTAWYPIWLGE